VLEVVGVWPMLAAPEGYAPGESAALRPQARGV